MSYNSYWCASLYLSNLQKHQDSAEGRTHSDRFIFWTDSSIVGKSELMFIRLQSVLLLERNVLSWKSRCFQVVVRRLMRCARANKHTIFHKYRPPQLQLAPHITLHTIDYTPPPLLNLNTNYCNIPPSSNYTTITLIAYTITPNTLPTSPS